MRVLFKSQPQRVNNKRLELHEKCSMPIIKQLPNDTVSFGTARLSSEDLSKLAGETKISQKALQFINKLSDSLTSETELMKNLEKLASMKNKNVIKDVILYKDPSRYDRSLLHKVIENNFNTAANKLIEIADSFKDETIKGEIHLLKTEFGDSPLEFALDKSNTEIAGKILDSINTVNDEAIRAKFYLPQTKYEKSHLNHATNKGNTEIAGKILDSVNAFKDETVKEKFYLLQEPSYEQSHLQVATDKGNTEIAAKILDGVNALKDETVQAKFYLLQNNVGNSSLHTAIAKDNTEIAEKILNNVNALKDETVKEKFHLLSDNLERIHLHDALNNNFTKKAGCHEEIIDKILESVSALKNESIKGKVLLHQDCYRESLLDYALNSNKNNTAEIAGKILKSVRGLKDEDAKSTFYSIQYMYHSPLDSALKSGLSGHMKIAYEIVDDMIQTIPAEFSNMDLGYLTRPNDKDFYYNFALKMVNSKELDRKQILDFLYKNRKLDPQRFDSLITTLE